MAERKVCLFTAMIGLAYSRSVYLLLLRRMRKRRFLISNFKHSTGLFELALPYPGTACSSLPSTKSKLKD